MWKVWRQYGVLLTVACGLAFTITHFPTNYLQSISYFFRVWRAHSGVLQHLRFTVFILYCFPSSPPFTFLFSPALWIPLSGFYPVLPNQHWCHVAISLHSWLFFSVTAHIPYSVEKLFSISTFPGCLSLWPVMSFLKRELSAFPPISEIWIKTRTPSRRQVSVNESQ